MSARTDALLRIEQATKAYLEGATMALPLRKSSLVSEAMDRARQLAMSSLTEAYKKYVNKIRELSYETLPEGSSLYSNFKNHRSAVEKSLQKFDGGLVELRKELTEAFEEYDLNVREIEAWLTATQAADKIAGREPNNSIRPFSYSDVRRP